MYNGISIPFGQSLRGRTTRGILLSFGDSRANPFPYAHIHWVMHRITHHTHMHRQIFLYLWITSAAPCIMYGSGTLPYQMPSGAQHTLDYAPFQLYTQPVKKSLFLICTFMNCFPTFAVLRYIISSFRILRWASVNSSLLSLPTLSSAGTVYNISTRVACPSVVSTPPLSVVSTLCRSVVSTLSVPFSVVSLLSLSVVSTLSLSTLTLSVV